MKLITIILIIISVSKLLLALSTNNINEDLSESLLEPEQMQKFSYAIIVLDGLIGLVCGIFLMITI